MSMATINLLLGIVVPFLAVGFMLGAVAYAVEGIRRSGFRRRWDLFVALLLGGLAYGEFTAVGQDFARASNRALLGQPADLTSLVAVVFWAVVSGVVSWAGLTTFRRVFRSPPS
ncbi:MAG TPA: hypothetical protein VGS80_17055 [Ktedonobacterales bacterium]|nr:hypothetical protein [Ktedonobacterales bacterium]